MKRFSCLLLSCCALLVLHGCGPANPFGTVAVTGIITVDGEPMEGVSISFSPVDSDGMGASGMTIADGSFRLTTGGAPFGTGAKPGTYLVTFSKVTPGGEGMSMAEFEAGGSRPVSGPPAPIHLIPERFNNPATTGFDPVEVKKRASENNFEFNIETK